MGPVPWKVKWRGMLHKGIGHSPSFDLTTTRREALDSVPGSLRVTKPITWTVDTSLGMSSLLIWQIFIILNT